MNNLISNIRNIFQKTKSKHVLSPLLSFTTKKVSLEEEIKDLLKKRFPEAKEISVTDTSGGCGAMFDIYVATKEFKGLSVMKQHRAIYDVLNEKIKEIHGLHIVTDSVKQ